MSDPWLRKEQIGGHEITFVSDEGEATVYAVKPSEAEPPVYIGSTTQVLRHRIRAHVRDAERGSQLPFHLWLRAHPKFVVQVMQKVHVSERAVAEQRWVSTYKGLLNVTDGGPGMSGHRFAGTDHARRIADRIRTASEYKCEQCGSAFFRKNSQAIKGNSRFCSKLCYQDWQRVKFRVAAE